MEQAETVAAGRRAMTLRGLLVRIWRVLARPSGQLSLGLLLLVGFLAGILFWGGFNWGMEATSNETFCRGCHEMDQNAYREFRTSAHDQNRSGVRATCPDCHVPHDWSHKIMRKIQASGEVFHHLLGDLDSAGKFEARRPEMAERVWATMKATDSRECRNCHNFDSMDLSRQNERARADHSRAETEGLTCIDCHKGIAHRLPVGTLDAERQLNETWNAAHPNPSSR
ncbi:NapC/NirT family cytochrome c [Telmatospirillum sp.]|uniref:NapC/NirT family cytochrome c n=1 Tax=Telmatospirillum sp. TaxID=2079197 RepID=UPI00283BA007|nr:NapC/NirT family cytochrome c [Telmatospirillum sp.]MDR3439394.1 NapC/NirT family cytochrome c [Telmatospirillum sp.]